MSELNNDVTPLIFGRPKPESAAPPANTAESAPTADDTAEFGTSGEGVEQPAEEPASEAVNEELETAAEVYAPVAAQPTWLWPGAAEAAAEPAHDQHDNTDEADDFSAATPEPPADTSGELYAAEDDPASEPGPEAEAPALATESAGTSAGAAEQRAVEPADEPIKDDLGSAAEVYAPVAEQPTWQWPDADAAAAGVPGQHDNTDDADESSAIVAEGGSGAGDVAHDEPDESGDAGESGVVSAEGGAGPVVDGGVDVADAGVEFTRDESDGPDDAGEGSGFSAVDSDEAAADDAMAEPETGPGGTGESGGADTDDAAEVADATRAEETAEVGEDLWPDIDDEEQSVDSGGYGQSDVAESRVGSAYGHPEVDAVVERLGELDQLETADHIEVYEDAHQRLHAALLAAGKDEGSAADSSSDYA